MDHQQFEAVVFDVMDSLPGWVHDRTGSYEPAFLGLAAATAVSWLLLLGVRDERRR